MWAPQNAGTKHSGCPCPPPFATQKFSLGVEDGAADEGLAQICLSQTLSPHCAVMEDSPACPDIPVTSKEINVLYFQDTTTTCPPTSSHLLPPNTLEVPGMLDLCVAEVVIS